MGLKTPLSDFYTNELFYGKTSAFNAATTPTTPVKILASDKASNDYFGHSVAVGCGRIVVGANLDDSPTINSGSAYIFDLNGTQLVKIAASDGAAEDEFGFSVAVGCGRIVVGSRLDDDLGSGSGSAYIYNLGGTQLAKIKASDGAASDIFGVSVAVGSGRIVVGAYLDDDNGSSSGSAYIFDLNGNQIAKIKASDAAGSDEFGFSVAVGSGRIVVGSYRDDAGVGSDAGAAYIFDLNGNQLAKIVANPGAGGQDYFGYSVAAGNGRIVVGAPYDDDLGTWSGSAFIYDINGTQLAQIKASDGAANDYFGWSVAVGSGRIVVGAWADADLGSGSGSAYIFDLNGTQLAKIAASDGASGDAFGRSVAVGSGRIVVTAYSDDDPAGQNNAGSAWIWTTPYQTHFLDQLDDR